MKKNLVLKEDIVNALGNIGVKKGDTFIGKLMNYIGMR